MTAIFEGNYKGEGLKVSIAVSRFNKLITEKLLEGALDGLLKSGVREEDIEIIWVPGSFELPLACKMLAKEGNFDAVIALGAIIRGATSHFDLVASQTASGIQQVSLESEVPVIFGVVTAENIDQAIERAGTKAGNRGFDAAIAAIETATLYRQLKRKGMSASVLAQLPTNKNGNSFSSVKEMSSRHYARKRAIQALYQLDALGDSKGETIKEFEEVYLDKGRKNKDKNHYQFFKSLLEGVLKNVSFLDEKIVTYSSRQKVSSIGRVERSILRVGAYELIFTKDTPTAVIIDEAVRLAKEFATEEAAIFVNGVLDKLGEERREKT